MAAATVLFLLLRFMLATENRRRDAAQRDDTYDEVYFTHVNEDGSTVEKRVDRVCFLLPDNQLPLMSI